jgi:hypothetical protein
MCWCVQMDGTTVPRFGYYLGTFYGEVEIDAQLFKDKMLIAVRKSARHMLPVALMSCPDPVEF